MAAVRHPPHPHPTENLLQERPDDSWTDTNLNRVSVIQFRDEAKEEAEEVPEERKVGTVSEDGWMDNCLLTYLITET